MYDTLPSDGRGRPATLAPINNWSEGGELRAAGLPLQGRRDTVHNNRLLYSKEPGGVPPGREKEPLVPDNADK